tara:strand:+ start:2330 stop:2593 length:264 start_codon:yes stop_codon:yes gene_type:complete
MAITKRTEEDKIEVVGKFKQIQVRTATIIEEDGKEISRSFHRHTVAPGADVSGESAEVQAIANAVHTDAVVSAYKDAQSNENPLDSE